MISAKSEYLECDCSGEDVVKAQAASGGRRPRSTSRRHQNAAVTSCDIARFWLSPRRPALLPASPHQYPHQLGLHYSAALVIGTFRYRNALLYSLKNCWTIGRMSALLALRNLKNSATLVPLSRSIVNRSALRPIPPTRGEDIVKAVVLDGLCY